MIYGAAQIRNAFRPLVPASRRSRTPPASGHPSVDDALQILLVSSGKLQPDRAWRKIGRRAIPTVICGTGRRQSTVGRGSRRERMASPSWAPTRRMRERSTPSPRLCRNWTPCGAPTLLRGGAVLPWACWSRTEAVHSRGLDLRGGHMWEGGHPPTGAPTQRAARSPGRRACTAVVVPAVSSTSASSSSSPRPSLMCPRWRCPSAGGSGRLRRSRSRSG